MTLMTKSHFAPACLVQTMQESGIDADPFPVAVLSRFGQHVALQGDEGGWSETLYIEHVGYGTKKVPWLQATCKNAFLEWAYRSWAIERIELTIDTRPIILIAKSLRAWFGVDESVGKPELHDKLFEWAYEETQRARLERLPDLQTGIKSFYSWCVNEDLWFSSEYRLLELLSIPSVGHGSEHLVSLLDPVGGPYSFNEMREIESTLEKFPELYRERTIFYLCRDWGLRPIQIALLREEDVGRDEVGPYVMVPSVKGRLRSSLRRLSSNFKRRHVAEETFQALNTLIDVNAEAIELTLQDLQDRNLLCANDLEKIGRPLIVSRHSLERAVRFLSDRKLTPYLLHANSGSISGLMSALTLKLSIMRRRGVIATSGNEPDNLLEIGCYRFRRTKGTSMVLNGFSPDEVAEALDHQSASTVGHYFKFNRDLIDYINAAHSSSSEIQAAVSMWSGKFAARESAVGKASVGDLGVCTRSSVCPHHPMVTCYSCSSFQPYVDGNHQGALESIERLRAQMGESATGPVKRQLDDSIRGVNAVIEAVLIAEQNE